MSLLKFLFLLSLFSPLFTVNAVHFHPSIANASLGVSILTDPFLTQTIHVGIEMDPAHPIVKAFCTSDITHQSRLKKRTAVDDVFRFITAEICDLISCFDRQTIQEAGAAVAAQVTNALTVVRRELKAAEDKSFYRRIFNDGRLPESMRKDVRLIEAVKERSSGSRIKPEIALKYAVVTPVSCTGKRVVIAIDLPDFMTASVGRIYQIIHSGRFSNKGSVFTRVKLPEYAHIDEKSGTITAVDILKCQISASGTHFCLLSEEDAKWGHCDLKTLNGCNLKTVHKISQTKAFVLVETIGNKFIVASNKHITIEQPNKDDHTMYPSKRGGVLEISIPENSYLVIDEQYWPGLDFNLDHDQRTQMDGDDIHPKILADFADDDDDDHVSMDIDFTAEYTWYDSARDHFLVIFDVVCGLFLTLYVPLAFGFTITHLLWIITYYIVKFFVDPKQILYTLINQFVGIKMKSLPHTDRALDYLKSLTTKPSANPVPDVFYPTAIPLLPTAPVVPTAPPLEYA